MLGCYNSYEQIWLSIYRMRACVCMTWQLYFSGHLTQTNVFGLSLMTLFEITIQIGLFLENSYYIMSKTFYMTVFSLNITKAHWHQ